MPGARAIDPLLDSARAAPAGAAPRRRVPSRRSPPAPPAPPAGGGPGAHAGRAPAARAGRGPSAARRRAAGRARAARGVSRAASSSGSSRDTGSRARAPLARRSARGTGTGGSTGCAGSSRAIAGEAWAGGLPEAALAAGAGRVGLTLAEAEALRLAAAGAASRAGAPRASPADSPGPRRCRSGWSWERWRSTARSTCSCPETAGTPPCRSCRVRGPSRARRRRCSSRRCGARAGDGRADPRRGGSPRRERGEAAPGCPDRRWTSPRSLPVSTPRSHSVQRWPVPCQRPACEALGCGFLARCHPPERGL